MNEIWRNVSGYEGLYQVSNLGNVRSLNWHGEGYTRNLYLKKHPAGYYQVELRGGECRSKMVTVHRLVAEAFLPNPLNLPCVNHKDEDKRNNQVENLEWCTYEYNNRYSRDLHPERFKPKETRSKRAYTKQKHLRIVQLSLNGEPIREWANATEINKHLGYSVWSISQCCRNKRHTAYGFRWQFAI